MTDLRRRAPPPVETWTPLEAVVSKDIFKAEVAAWEKRLRVEPREVHVRPMRRKWGSCSTSGRVTFNAELLSESAAFRKRVIVEELLHLKVPNHGRLFRALLKAHLGRDVDAQPRRRIANEIGNCFRSEVPLESVQESRTPKAGCPVSSRTEATFKGCKRCQAASPG